MLLTPEVSHESSAVGNPTEMRSYRSLRALGQAFMLSPEKNAAAPEPKLQTWTSLENAYSCEILLQGDAIYHTRQTPFNEKYAAPARTAWGRHVKAPSTEHLLQRLISLPARVYNLSFSFVSPWEIEWAS